MTAKQIILLDYVRAYPKPIHRSRLTVSGFLRMNNLRYEQVDLALKELVSEGLLIDNEGWYVLSDATFESLVRTRWQKIKYWLYKRENVAVVVSIISTVIAGITLWIRWKCKC